ncbi:unnamed protein product [Paramecium octaurelia]|uniref:Transmembrane protein n=1 Tax=Paramecium octaurelia TaxID=43137 RepID=A0A8S1W0W4_PAROT|nr:unnamed protein product [Paramecium octaurelia]
MKCSAPSVILGMNFMEIDESCLECTVVNYKMYALNVLKVFEEEIVAQQIIIVLNVQIIVSCVIKEMRVQYIRLIHYLSMSNMNIILIIVFPALVEILIRNQAYFQIVKKVHAHNILKSIQIEFVVKIYIINNWTNYKVRRRKEDLPFKIFKSYQLFSTTSCSQEFYQMAYQKSIKQVLIKIFRIQNQRCYLNDEFQISQSFSTNIFSAMQSQQFFNLKMQNLKFMVMALQFSSRKIIHHSSLKITIFLSISKEFAQKVYKLKWTIFHLAQVQQNFQVFLNKQLNWLIYQQDYDLTTFYVIMENAKNVVMQNFWIKDFRRKFSIQAFIQIKQMQLPGNQIKQYQHQEQ